MTKRIFKPKTAISDEQKSLQYFLLLLFYFLLNVKNSEAILKIEKEIYSKTLSKYNHSSENFDKA